MGVLIFLVLFFGFIALYGKYSEDSGSGSSCGGGCTGAGNRYTGWNKDDRDYERPLDDDLPEDEDYCFGGSFGNERDYGFDYDDDPDDYDRDVDDFDDDDGDFD